MPRKLCLIFFFGDGGEVITLFEKMFDTDTFIYNIRLTSICAYLNLEHRYINFKFWI